MDSVTSRPEADEVISPELVLVDPELARIARRELRQAPGRQARPRLHVVPAATIARAEPWRAGAEHPNTDPRPLANAVGVVGALATAIPVLLLGAIAVGMVGSEVQAQRLDDPIALVAPSAEVSPPRASPPPRALRHVVLPRAITPAPARPASARPTKPPKAPPKPRAVAPAQDARRWIPTKSQVEARTLMLLQERGARSVPVALIDRRSGLFANNVHAVCRQVGRTPRFNCRLGIGLGAGGEWLLTVVVARDGSEKLTWRGHAAAR